MLLIGEDRRLDRRANHARIVGGARLSQPDLRLVELLDRLPGGLHQHVAQVVEVAVEERPPDPGPLHHRVDAELGVGASANQFGRRGDDPGARLLAALASLGLALRRAHAGWHG